MTNYLSVYRIILMSAFVTCMGIAGAAAAIPLRYHVTDLGTPGGSYSEAYGINESGQVTGVSRVSGDAAIHAFLWTPTTSNGASGTMQDLGTLGGSQSYAYGINDSAHVTGYSYTTDDAVHAYLYDGTMHDLGTLVGITSIGYGINNSGHVTGRSQTVEGDFAAHHAILHDGMFHDLGTLGGIFSEGRGINASGQVTGYSIDGNLDQHAFLWTPTTPGCASGTMLDIGTLGGTYSQGNGINASGQVVGSSTTESLANHAFLYDGAMHDLGTLGGGSSLGFGINAVGLVVGYSSTAGDAESHAFLHASESGMVDLHSLIDPLSGWVLSFAMAINDAGQIAGLGVFGGESHAFLLTPVPEPVSAVLFALALLGLVLNFGRRERRWALPYRTLVAMSIALLVSAGPASAATFSASSVPELISSIHAANQNAEPDSIALAAGGAFTLTVSNVASGLPTIAASEGLTIFGNGGIIERSTSDGTPSFRLFDIAAGASLRLENLTLQRGVAFGSGVAAHGGAILNQGMLTLQDVVVQNNQARTPNGRSIFPFYTAPTTNAVGGGIYSSGSLTVEGGSIQDNQAIGGIGRNSVTARGGGDVPSTRGGHAFGGGLYVAGGTANLQGVSLMGNWALGGRGGNGHPTHGAYGGASGGAGSGAGVYVASGTVNLTDVAGSSNSATGGAGGAGGHGAFTGNGGNGGAGSGGALYAAGSTIGIRDSTLTANSAQGGAAGLKGRPSANNGTPGEGKGGGVHNSGAQVSLDHFTLVHVTSNTASTSHPNIFGPFETVTNPNPLPGDYNDDGAVDLDDLAVWQGAFETGSAADADNDGDSDGNDFLAWQRQLGRTNSNIVLAGVPEPTAAAMLLGGWLAMFGCRRVAVS